MRISIPSPILYSPDFLSFPAPPSSPSSLAHSGVGVRSSTARKAASWALYKWASLLVFKSHIAHALPSASCLLTALSLAPAPAGLDTHPPCWPSPPPCRSHRKSLVLLAVVPVSSEPDLAAWKITAHLAQHKSWLSHGTPASKHGGVEITDNSCGRRQQA